ncbi:MAG TPA: M28 family peptidase, partial [Planctomycetota bacterium]|nr:M28 family peptidase [Planctomycetota bacterium]
MKALATILGLLLLAPGHRGTEIRGPRHPALSPDGTRIAFDWHGDLWVCPVEGGKAERLTDDPADEEKPAWSPDGTQIAYSSDKAGNRDIYVLDLGTRTTRQLTYHSADDDSPAWSPDGKWIAFQSNRDSNLDLPLNNNVWDLWKVPSTGGTAVRVTRYRGENPAWSADGKWIAYDRYSSGYGDGEHNIFLISPDGAGVPVEIASGSEDSRHPTFKGKTVYFADEANGIQASGFRNVWKTTTGGGALIQVTGHRGGQVTWPTTCEKSDTLVYEFEFDLYSIDLGHPKPRRLALTTDLDYPDPPVQRTYTTGFHAPAWSPDGSRIAFACQGDLFVTAVGGGEAKALTSGLDEDRDPSWSADGKAIAFCSGPPAMPVHVYLMELRSGERRRLTPEPGMYRHPRVSPDGSRVLVTRQQEEGSELWILERGTARALAPAKDAETYAGCFSPDGKLLAWLSQSGGKSQIVLASSDGAEVKRLDLGGPNKRDLAWSPDGERFAFVARQGQNRWVLQSSKTDGTDLRTLAPGLLTASWAPDSSMVVGEVEGRGQREAETLTIADGRGPELLALKTSVTRATTRREEMLGVFQQVYGSYVGNYYDPFFHGMDMPSLRDKYAPLAAACQTKAELYDRINEMIKELHSSHIHLVPAPVKNSVVTGSLACDWVRAPDGTLVVRNVEPGGPADRLGLKEGDKIVGAQGRPLGPDTDFDRLLTCDAGKAPGDLRVQVVDASGQEREILSVKGLDRNALRELKYDNSIARRKAFVKERSGGKLAYHHIKMMVQAEVQRLKNALEGLPPEVEGLVLDERDGVGGLAHRPVCALLDSTAPDRLNRAPACTMRNRNGSTVVDLYGSGQGGGRPSGKSWDRPVIMLQNSISRSDKEILPYTFRHLGIGYLVGMPTAGGVIGGSDWTMQDGSKITVSVQGWFTSDGRNMEGWGVPPDFRVPETHEDLCAGRDAQLEKAVEVLLAQLDGRIAPPRKPGQNGKSDAPAAAKKAPTLEEHVRFLASPELKGREAGSDGEKKAAEYIEAQLRKMGIPVQVQEFDAHAGIRVRNVIGVIRGSSEEAVVLGAHYDHLGEIKGEIHPGADDNASGTAVLLEVAGRLARTPPRRTVVLAAFSGEEFGAFGSRYYVNHPVVSLEKTVAMVNMDMVGRLKDKLIV